jgi:hypothetical protein
MYSIDWYWLCPLIHVNKVAYIHKDVRSANVSNSPRDNIGQTR